MRKRRRSKALSDSSSSAAASSEDGRDINTCPSLIVAPASIIENWCEELSKWGHFLMEKATSSTMEHLAAVAKERKVELVLCSYDTMRTFSDALSEIEWEIIVWDEGHR
jgi:SNF2 family DNA or RNA helicase